MRRFRERRVTKGFVGTPAWMAPEVLVCAAPDAQGYSFAADIWSAGCVVYAVLTGRLDAGAALGRPTRNQVRLTATGMRPPRCSVPFSSDVSTSRR